MGNKASLYLSMFQIQLAAFVFLKGSFQFQADGQTPGRVIFQSMIHPDLFMLPLYMMFEGLENQFCFA